MTNTNISKVLSYLRDSLTPAQKKFVKMKISVASNALQLGTLDYDMNIVQWKTIDGEIDGFFCNECEETFAPLTEKHITEHIDEHLTETSTETENDEKGNDQ